MNTEGGGGNKQDHVIDMDKLKQERVASMEAKLLEDPKLLSKAAGKRSCCIFRVPQSLIEANGKAYQPRIVSIGPYHRAQPRLTMIQEHKWRYLRNLLSRTHLTLRNLVDSISPLESDARECYSEAVQLDSHEFNEMMILDACFIIELFRKVSRLVPFEIDDPIVTMSWILPFFYRDFLKLENQIPFFIIQNLFHLTNSPAEQQQNSNSPTLSALALEFFNNSFQKPDEFIASNSDTKGMHLLDLVRSSFIPKDLQDADRKRVVTPTHVIHCVSKLRRAGIKMNPGNQMDTFLHVTFRHGVITMPTITVDDFMSSFLVNCVAYEQCYSACSKQFTTYVTLLDCLINTYRDVEYLCDRNILENHFGTEGEVAHFVNSAGKDVAVDLDLSYLSRLFNQVHDYYRNSWHVQWASFKYTYFDTPWSFISALAAFVLLLLTVAQTYFAAYQYFSPQKNN